MIVLLLLAIPGLAYAAPDDNSTVADEETINSWQDYAKDSTQTVGRIWTDKTVNDGDIELTGDIQDGTIKISDGADFLVGLSALSSTSNLTSTTSTPLDIVLLLDTSGSMEDMITSTVYVPTFNVREPETGIGGIFNETYYGLTDDGKYIEIEAVYSGGIFNREFDHWEFNGVTIEPKTSNSDNTPNHIQFYTRDEVEGDTSKMAALQSAVNSFIDSTAAENQKIGEASRQHRISLVTYAGSSTIQNDFSIDFDAMKQTVNGLNGNGGTYVNYGMENVETVINGNEREYQGARQDAKTVVIFFTDGEPGSGNSVEANVAGPSINSAKDLKDNGTLIYSVGVLGDADPSDTENAINAFMNGMSSNYPNASYTEASGWFPSFMDGLTLGARDEEGDYYKAATNADDLNTIFQDIFESVSTGVSSPTEVTSQEGFDGANGGYITFTDKLGEYMEVKGNTMTLVYANQQYAGQRQGNSFVFSGTVDGNGVYPDGDLSNLKVTVENNTVTVQIPAQLIPLRNYDVDTTNNTMSTTAAYPIRLFYSVGLQDGVEDKVNNPDDAMNAYIAANKADDGTVAFYSNDWNRETAAAGTTATFTPASTNKFYYFTEDTPLYTDEACMMRATWQDIEYQQVSEVYYEYPYYTQNADGTGMLHDNAIAIPVEVFKSQHANNWGVDDDYNAYMKAHTPRLSRADAFVGDKETNITGTATQVISPSWNDNQSGIVVSLGNNGKVSVEQGATLEVKKNITASEGFDASKYTNTPFTFDIAFTNVPNGNYKAEVKQNGAVVSSPDFTVNVSGGKATHTITPNQTLYIYGLPAGGSYTVTEQTVAGFTQVADATTGTNGTFEAGKIATAQFTNNYSAEATQLADGTLKVQKDFDGREWREGDEFTFTIDTASNAPLPNPATVTVNKNTQDLTAAFGAITYTTPDEYRYVITENRGNLVGVNYSGAQWRVIVTVVDNGNGTMTATPVVEKLTGDDGVDLDAPQAAQNNIAVFGNIYTTDGDAVLNLGGTKSYTDNSVTEGAMGGNPIDQNKFTFQLGAKGGYVTNGGSDQDLTINAADVPMPIGAEGTTIQQGNVSGAFNFPNIEFGSDCVGNTYVYEVTEVAGTEENMTYDKTVYTVKVEVTEATEGEGSEAHAHITATPTYSTPKGEAAAIAFSNSYTPDAATLTGNTAIAGTKTMSGRDMLEGEEFTFTLTPTGNTVAAINNGTVTGITEAGLTSTAAKDGADGVAVDFNFADITFTKVGVYTFTMSENVPADENKAGGVTYDGHDCTVTVNVTLNKETGALEAAVDYGTTGGAAGNAFTNVYAASMSYDDAGSLTVAKTTQGRPMFASEFEFTIEGADSNTVSAADANAKLSDNDKSFTNADAAEGAEWSVAKLSGLTFTQADAGKTYSYIVDEVLPAQQKPSLTYDQNAYRVDIEVVDDLDGTMHTVTRVYRTANAEGEPAEPELLGTYNSAEGRAAKVSFTNVYEPTPAVLEGSTALSVTKKVTGAETDTQFDFTLKLTSNNAANVEGLDENGEMTASTSGTLAEGSETPVSFGKLTFTKQGVYEFQVTEKQGGQGADGWTYDESTHSITVTVSPLNDEGEYDGALHVSVVSGNNPTFTNSYAAQPVVVGGEDATQHLSVEKTVEGRGTEADFNFTLSKVNPDDPKWNNVEAAEGADKTAITENFNAGDKKTANFGMFTFKAEGTYQFQVVEDEAQADVPAGWTYDKDVKTITVGVTDNGRGQLVAEISGAAAFANSYSITPATVTGAEQLKGAKTLEGRDSLTDETFDFTMTPDEATVQAIEDGDIAFAANADKASVGNLSNGVAKGFNFGNITINKAGTYTFTVSENLPDGVTAENPTKNGVTYDTNTHTVTIKAEDAGNGTFNVTVEGADALNFTNTYAAEPAFYGVDSTLLGGTKTVVDEANGYAIKDGDFGFYMRAQDAGNPLPTGEGVEEAQNAGLPAAYVKNTKSNPANDTAAYDFGVIEFNTEDMVGATDNGDGTLTKTFQYNIFEDSGVSVPGISIDATAYTVTFTVVENQNDGTMTIQSVVPKKLGSLDDPTGGEEVGMNELNFTNTFDSGKITATANILKILDGRNFAEGEGFTFNVVVTAKEADGQPMAYDDIPKPYEGTGTGSYLGEPEPNDTGDGYSYIVGMHTGSGTETGYTMRSNVGFFDYTRVGTYEFTITEQGKGETKGNLTYSDAEYKVRVVISMDETDPNKPVIKREVWINDVPAFDNPAQPNTLDFTNVYRPGNAVLEGDSALAVQKTLAGRDWTAGDKFNFTLTAVTEGAPMPEGAEGNVANLSVTSDAAKAGEAVKAAFGAITFTKDNLGTGGQPVMSKQFVYEIDETNTDGYGLTMDAHVATFTVSVTDDGNGNLSADVEYSNAGATDTDAALTNIAAFTNTYAAASATNTPAGVTKVLDGRTPGLQAGEFNFTMSVEAAQGSPADGFIMPSDATATNDGNGTVTFDNIAFTKAGTYHVTVKENVPAEADRAPFMTYDEHAYTYDVVVTDNGQGQLVAEVQNVDGSATFTNTYKADEPSKTVGTASDPTTSIGDTLVGVGDELTYTINWVNNALDPETGKSVAANVTITDVVPAGTEFVSASEGGTYDADSDTVTWSLGERAAGAKGSVTLTVRVTDEAAQYNKVENTANIVVGENSPQTVTDPGVHVPGKSVSGVDEGDAPQVGDVLTYTIQYANDQDTPATVTVTDVVPEGLTVDVSSLKDGGTYDEASRTITWTFENMAPKTDDVVTFNAVVNEDAVRGAIENQAVIMIGDHEVKTNTSTTPAPKTADIGVSKTIELTEGQGTQIDTQKEFTFTVALKDNAGNALTGEYALVDAEGTEIQKLTDGGTFTLTHDQTVTIKDLPEGARVTVTEVEVPGYTATDSTLATVVGAEDQPQSLDFVNTYSASASTGTPENFTLYKVLQGRDWNDGDSFKFTLKADGNAPLPATDSNVGVVNNGDGTATRTLGASAADGDKVPFDFGMITYTAAGTYTYTVTEEHAGELIDGVTYSTNAAKVTVEVRDNGNGGLTAAATIVGDTFTNVYNTGTVDYDQLADGGLEIVKNLTGRDIDAGQFDFEMKAMDDVTAAKWGHDVMEYTTTEAALGEDGTATAVMPIFTQMVFDKSDAGKTYTFQVRELDDKAPGYTYDGTVYELKFAVFDNDSKGVLTVEVYVNGELNATHTGDAAQARADQTVQLVFNNTYDAGSVTVGGEGEAQIVASKELTGRDQIAGEFTFSVYNAAPAAAELGPVATGSNAADGTVTFGAIEYTTESLNRDVAKGLATRTAGDDGADVYTYQYTVSEDEASFDEGVAAVVKSFNLTVKVTDGGLGNLTAAVEQPAMVFQNTYGAGETAAVAIKGTKVLEVESGDNAPDIAGKYQFTLTGEDGAPMPEGSEGGSKTVVNDAFGNVDFGTIVYTMENVFGGEVEGGVEDKAEDGLEARSAERSKTFTYTVEEGGSVPGVANDAEAVKTVRVTVTDNGDGTLGVAKSTAGEATDFAFVNTYSVQPTDPVSPTDPSVEGAVKVTKQLTGRELVEGEFAFELRDEAGTLVSEGVNDAAGNVSLDGITFMAPGTYKFGLSEVVPDGDLKGVTYDGTIHPLTATVTDNGDGTMSVAWSASNEEIVFRNAYEPAPTSVTLGAAKVLEGADLADGQFTFQMLDREGKVFRTAKNDEGGQVTFGSIEFTQEGTYTYAVVEVDDGQEGVTYDDARHEVVVTVADDGEGNLTAEVEGAEGLVFENRYAAPADPEPAPLPPVDAGDGDGLALVRTGDAAPAAPLVGGALAALAALALAGRKLAKAPSRRSR